MIYSLSIKMFKPLADLKLFSFRDKVFVFLNETVISLKNTLIYCKEYRFYKFYKFKNRYFKSS